VVSKIVSDPCKDYTAHQGFGKHLVDENTIGSADSFVSGVARFIRDRQFRHNNCWGKWNSCASESKGLVRQSPLSQPADGVSCTSFPINALMGRPS
jgi:hypothetical protein